MKKVPVLVEVEIPNRWFIAIPKGSKAMPLQGKRWVQAVQSREGKWLGFYNSHPGHSVNHVHS